jgi:hypothetical protein
MVNPFEQSIHTVKEKDSKVKQVLSGDGYQWERGV